MTRRGAMGRRMRCSGGRTGGSWSIRGGRPVAADRYVSVVAHDSPELAPVALHHLLGSIRACRMGRKCLGTDGHRGERLRGLSLGLVVVLVAVARHTGDSWGG